MDPCWYVTAAWGIHDERWTAALREQRFEPHIISLEREGITIDQARAMLIEAATQGDTSPVLAGPITTVTTPLVGIPQRLIGLSWGFDLLKQDDARQDNLNRLDHLIVDSPASAAVAELCGLRPKSITRIYWGVDLDTFSPSGPTADLTGFGVPTGSPTVLSLRAHENLYRVEDLIEAWSEVHHHVPNAHLLVGNSGSLTKSLEDRARELGLNHTVHFIGRIPESELGPLLRAVLLYVSTSPIDGTSVTLLQAMACGCPVLVTDASGNRHWIDAQINGYLYPPADSNELTKQIVRALKDSGSAAQTRMIDAALIRVRAEADWHANQRLLRGALSPT